MSEASSRGRAKSPSKMDLNMLGCFTRMKCTVLGNIFGAMGEHTRGTGSFRQSMDKVECNLPMVNIFVRIGRVYDGAYAFDKRNGFGILSWPNGKKYIGLWQEGLQHGTGEFH
jgi:hypothetical protein